MAKQFTSLVLTSIVKTYYLYPYSLLISDSIKTKFSLLYLSTTEATRKYCKNVILNNNECNNQEVDKNCTNLNENRNLSLIKDISNILSIDINEALKIYNGVNETKKLSEDVIINVINTAKDAGISAPAICNNISILIQNMDSLNKKLGCIKHLNDNIDEMLPLLNINLTHLNMLLASKQHVEPNGINKITYLANALGCSISKLCKLIVQEPIIITLPANRIQTVVTTLKDFNYETEDILNNLWLFKYSPRTIRSRSSTVKLAGLNAVKSWVIRCSVYGLQRYVSALKREAGLHTIYGSHVHLLSTKLKVTEKEVEFYIERYPDILEVQLDKINDVLDILLEYGYSATDILTCPRIFLLKITLLKERLEKMKAIKGPRRLSLIYSSTKIFEKFIKQKYEIYNIKSI